MAQATLRMAEVGRRVSVGMAARPAVSGGGVIFSRRLLKQGVWDWMAVVNL